MYIPDNLSNGSGSKADGGSSCIASIALKSVSICKSVKYFASDRCSMHFFNDDISLSRGMVESKKD